MPQSPSVICKRARHPTIVSDREAKAAITKMRCPTVAGGEMRNHALEEVRVIAGILEALDATQEQYDEVMGCLRSLDDTID